MCNFGDSALELSAHVFAFKTGIAQYKHDNKLYTNNLNY